MHHIFKTFHIKEQPKFQEKIGIVDFVDSKECGYTIFDYLDVKNQNKNYSVDVNLRPGFNQSSQNEIYKDVLLELFWKWKICSTETLID